MKLIKESLGEFVKSQEVLNEEELNEAFYGPRTLKKKFLSAGHAYVKAKNGRFLKGLLYWGTKLSKMDWPKDKVFKSNVTPEEYKKFHNFLSGVSRDLNPLGEGGRGAQREKMAKFDGGDKLSDDEKIAIITKAIKKDVSYIKDMLA